MICKSLTCILAHAYRAKRIGRSKHETRCRMIDINLIRSNPELVKANIQKKFQDHKLPLVDEALALDARRRALIAEGDALRAARNTLSKQVGAFMKAGQREEAEKVLQQIRKTVGMYQ